MAAAVPEGLHRRTDGLSLDFAVGARQFNQEG